MNPHTRYRPRGEFVARQIAGDALLVPVRGQLADLQRLYAFEGAGDFIWERLAGGRSLGEIHAALCAAFEVTPTEAESDLAAFVAELLQTGLIEPVG